ncbi:Oidioi.mRNA.OKI2018_I69.XSR.g16983.t1.cds [Oikopleura dioica]|uniref:DNA replication complex GINS protein PSF1 n=1 Tax=Oikopleura dioica TaxID=34765 RepID=A0ABN7SHS4_OIKDI|nr:Oidioi.mRNA.OKI2018_I69.XSR.g16983.t1.cds [Oikopleura dioica]
MSAGDTATELIKDLVRARDTFPNYDDVAVREIVDESIGLFNKNREDLKSKEMEKMLGNDVKDDYLEEVTVEERSRYVNVVQRVAAIERNKRCMIAYHMRRLAKIRDLRWQAGPVIPEHIRPNLSASEKDYSNKYNRALAKLMRAQGIDFTQNSTPPKSLFVEVKGMADVGEVELANGETLTVDKFSRYFLPRANVEPLIRQGILMEIERQV